MALIERAQRARETLFGRYDELNALWSQAEKELAKLHIPRPVDVRYDGCSNEDGSNEGDCLGVHKIKGAWRICHASYRGHDCWDQDEMSDWTPITECSVETRIRAARYIRKLQEAVVKSAEDFIPEVEDAISKLQNALTVPDEHLSALFAERAKLNGKAK